MLVDGEGSPWMLAVVDVDERFVTLSNKRVCV
jgi:hypothetical protein